jgi:ribosome-binding factor A
MWPMEERRNSNRKFKIQEVLREIVSTFINGETNKTSLITVTRVDVSPNLSTCDIYVTVFPESAEESALNFLKRKRIDTKDAIKKRMHMRKIPFVDFKIDEGEKNRQRIQDISSNLD